MHLDDLRWRENGMRGDESEMGLKSAQTGKKDWATLGVRYDRSMRTVQFG